jgi:hypothetical protein
MSNYEVTKVYPTLTDGVLLTCGNAAAWTLGEFAEIIPAAAISTIFSISGISIEAISANGVYELAIYHGTADAAIGRVRFTKTAQQDGTMNMLFSTPILPTGDRIRAKVASSTGDADTVRISIIYHVYS